MEVLCHKNAAQVSSSEGPSTAPLGPAPLEMLASHLDSGTGGNEGHKEIPSTLFKQDHLRPHMRQRQSTDNSSGLLLKKSTVFTICTQYVLVMFI
jgi:hypothetical protein